MKDHLPLFSAFVEPFGEKYRAHCREFPRVYGYGDTPEGARNSLRRMVLEVWFHFRTPA